MHWPSSSCVTYKALRRVPVKYKMNTACPARPCVVLDLVQQNSYDILTQLIQGVRNKYKLIYGKDTIMISLIHVTVCFLFAG